MMGREDIEITQHHEDDEGLVEVETNVGALLEPPESKGCSSKPAEPARKLLLRKMELTFWRGEACPPPHGQPLHFQPDQCNGCKISPEQGSHLPSKMVNSRVPSSTSH